MATFDAAWCLLKFDQLAGRPDTDEITDATKYVRLSEAQQSVVEDVAAIYPYCMYRSGGPTTLTTTGNKVYTFGTDGQGTHAMGPIGHVSIFRNLSDYPWSPMQEGVDYLNEGTQIRIPSNNTESSTLYWMGIPIPADITAAVEPSLRPAPSRILIVIKAVWHFAEEGNQMPSLADAMERRYGQEFAKHMLVWRTAFRAGGALRITGLDRALLAQS